MSNTSRIPCDVGDYCEDMIDGKVSCEDCITYGAPEHADPCVPCKGTGVFEPKDQSPCPDCRGTGIAGYIN